jgi:hypothetical protein
VPLRCRRRGRGLRPRVGDRSRHRCRRFFKPRRPSRNGSLGRKEGLKNADGLPPLDTRRRSNDPVRRPHLSLTSWARRHTVDTQQAGGRPLAALRGPVGTAGIPEPRREHRPSAPYCSLLRQTADGRAVVGARDSAPDRTSTRRPGLGSDDRKTTDTRGETI